jgi:hypothetical protein
LTRHFLSEDTKEVRVRKLPSNFFILLLNETKKSVVSDTPAT